MRISDWSSDVCSSDLETREALIPDYGFGCKRPSMSNTYLKTFNQHNVDLITTPIRSITPTGVRTDDGVLHKADVLICATGFHVMGEQEPVPFPISGRTGVEQIGRASSRERVCA